MADNPHLSDRVRRNPLAQSKAGLERLSLGMRRILSVLEREEAAAVRTLEMKISDAGPTPQRVEPHILGVAGQELVHRGSVKIHRYPESGTHNWYAPARLPQAAVDKKVGQLLPVYKETIAPRLHVYPWGPARNIHLQNTPVALGTGPTANVLRLVRPID